MDLASIAITVLIAVIGGLLGASCALVPGFHSNALALVLLTLLGPLSFVLSNLASLACCPVTGTMLFAALLVAAATSHSFVDFVPSIFLGVPDEDTVLSMLPAHRLLKSGKGMDAIRHAALGSLFGALIAILLAIPLQLLLRPPSIFGEVLDASVLYLLVAVLALLILTERGHEPPRAHLDARSGGLLPQHQITISHPIPVNGVEGIISGRVSGRGLISFRLSTPWGHWKVVSGLRKPSGFVTVRGTWVVKKGSNRSRLAAVGILILSGLLGFVVMNSRPLLDGIFDGFGQSLLFPLLSGLFAFPALLSATSSKPIPVQIDAEEGEGPAIGPALTGTFAGFLAGWMPGITSTIGTVIGSSFSTRPKDQEQGAKTYILMLSAVGTSSVVFSLLALCIEGSGRTGAMLALKQSLGQEDLSSLSSFPSATASLLLIAVLVASAIGYRYTIWAGSVLSRRTAGRDLGRINRFALLGLMSLILTFNGLPGFEVTAVATLVGILPLKLGVRRVHLTGCLLVPLILFYLGMESEVIGLLW